MIDPLATWKSTFNALPKVGDSVWADNFAKWYKDRIIAIEPDPSKLTAVGFVFKFDAEVFAAALKALTPTSVAAEGVSKMADAWLSAISLVVYPATLSVSVGSFVSSASPPTLFSVIISVLLDPSSILSAKAKLLELITSPKTAGNDSKFPELFREATLLLSITVTGLNSVPPPPGPMPLVAALVPLI